MFQGLRPEYDLDDEEISDIFDMTDENKVLELKSVSELFRRARYLEITSTES